MKKIFSFWVLIFFFILNADEAQLKPKYGPQKAPAALPLSQDNNFFRENPAPDFWALIPYYVPQMTPYSCSAASISIVLNGAKSKIIRTEDDKNISEMEILEKVNVENFKELLSEKGFKGRRGVSIEALGKVVEASLKAFDIPYLSVHVEALNKDMPDIEEKKKRLLEVMEKSEKSGRDFIIAHFNQSVFTDSASGAHISPVGAFDNKNKRVLILDVDREWYEPYWVSFDTFFKGLSEPSQLYGGYDKGGYVWISLK